MPDRPSEGQPPPESSPPAVEATRSVGGVNDPIPLYNGPVTYDQGGPTFSAQTRVTFCWLPRPHIRFDADELPAEARATTDMIRLSFGDGSEATGRVRRVGHWSVDGRSQYRLSGRLTDGAVHPADSPARHATFLIPNVVSPLGRVVLEGGGWVVTLEDVEGASTVVDELNEGSGYGVTQEGRLEKRDGTPFTEEEAAPVLDGLQRFLSFCAGRWTAPCLFRGFAPAGAQVWEVWDAQRVSPYQLRVSWHDHMHGDQPTQLFPGFMARWTADGWREVVALAVHWYIEANAQAGSAEGSIVLTQTALEMLAAAVLVEELRQISRGGFDGLNAAEQIRRLMVWAGIPASVPAELDHLVRLGGEESWADLLDAFAKVRNKITHPTFTNTRRVLGYPVPARLQMWAAGLWVLELCLLRLFGYHGKYARRFGFRHSGDVEAVPWAGPQTPGQSPGTAPEPSW